MNTPARFSLATALAAVGLALMLLPARAAEPKDAAPTSTNEPAAAVQPPVTNAPVELRLNPQDLEHFRREMEQAAARNTQMFTAALEPVLDRQHQREMEILQNANRTIFIAAGAFAAAGLLGFVLIAWMLVRAMSRFSELVAQHGGGAHALGPGRIPAALGPGETSVSAGDAAEQANVRFMGAIERLEKRIKELELTTPGAVIEADHHVTGEEAVKAGHAPAPAHTNGRLEKSAAATPSPQARVEMLLGKGQALLNLGEAEPAAACFEEVLRLQPGHADALVRKGQALERLQQFDQAIECYDRAIAADASMTAAWLYKGGLCNRLQRHQEALDCYEKAIRQEPRAPAAL